MSEPAANSLANSKPPHRWKRRYFILGAGVTLLIAGHFILTHPKVLGSIALWQLGKMAGGDLQARTAQVGTDGKVWFDDVKLIVPNISGPAAEVFTAQRIDAHVDLWAILRGGRIVDSVTLTRPHFRLSQNITTGEVNASALAPARRNRSGEAVAIEPARVTPIVKITEGVIEIGEHTQTAGFTVLKRMDIEGDVQAMDTPGTAAGKNSPAGAYSVMLRQVGPPGSPNPVDGLTITGRVTEDRIDLTMNGLSLKDCPPEALPTPLRDAYRELNLSGEISGATLTYRTGETRGLEVTIGLLDVALDLPLKPQPGIDKDDRVIPVPDELSDRRLHMEDVKGSVTIATGGVRGSLEGLLEEFPFHIELAYNGTANNSPFTATLTSKRFELTSQPRLALFAPGVVRRRLEQFGNPTGIVDANITIARAQPNTDGTAAEPTVNGTLSLHSGSAAFERFPYRFYNLSLNAVFTDQTLELRDIKGDTPDGALLNATTSISPLTDDAGVSVDINVTQLPVDAKLAAALRQRGQIIEALFSHKQYERLLATGLVKQPGGSAQEIADSVPEFAPGGLGSVKVNVTRKAGPESIWDDEVTVHFPKVGVLPEAFPYPMLATDVTIHKINYDTKVTGGEYRGLRGGRARMEATVDLIKLDAPDAPFVPNVSIKAWDIPTDDYLYFALPSAASLSPDGRPLGELVQDFRLQGTGNATAQIGQLEGTEAAAYGNTSYDIAIDVAGISAHPHRDKDPQRTVINNLAGNVRVKHTGLHVDITGKLSDGSPSGTSSPVAIKADFNYAPRTVADKGELSLNIQAARLDTSFYAEDIVSIVAPDVAEQLRLLRLAHKPSGYVDLVTRVHRKQGSGPLHATTTLSRPETLGFDAIDTRFIISAADTTTAWTTIIDHDGGTAPGTQDGIVTFNNAAVKLLELSNGSLHSVGIATLNGNVSTDITPDATAPLRILASGVRLDSPLITSILRRTTPSGVHSYLSENTVGGEIELDITAAAEKSQDTHKIPDWQVTGTIKPRKLTAVMSGVPVTFDQIDGSVVLTTSGGLFDNLQLRAADWTGAVQGSFERLPSGTSISTKLTIDAKRLTPDLRAVLPLELRTILTDLSVSIDGPVFSRDVILTLNYDTQGALQGFSTQGQVSAQTLGLDAGIKVSNAATVLDFEATRTGATSPVLYTAWAHCPTLNAGDVQVTSGKLKVTHGEVPGSVIIPHFSGDCHGGRISGNATAFAPGADGKRDFSAQAQGSNIRFASVLADIRAAKNITSTEPVNADTALDGSRGMIDFGLTLTGTANDINSRRGRGSATVTGGRVLSVPLVVPLIKMSNFQLPTTEKLDYAQADFFLQGQTIQFEQAWVSSPGVDLIGYGTMEWPSLAVDARVRGKSRTRIPILTKVIENIRDELFTARVTGSASDLKIGFENFSGTGRLLERIVGKTPSEADERLRRIEKNADLSPKRNKQVVVEGEGTHTE